MGHSMPGKKFSLRRIGWMAAAFGLGLLPVLPIWIRGNSMLLEDLLLAYYCYFADFHRNWAWTHPLPLWSGSYQCGMPMNAYWQSAYLYPLTWILFGPFSPLHTIYLFYGLHFGLAIAGFLVLGPELGLIRPAAFWSGMAFGLSGTMLARYEHTTFLAGWSYMPLVLGLYLRLERAPTFRRTLWLALALTLQTLGGHPQATIATAVLLGFFFLRGCLSPSLPKKKLAAPVTAALAAGILCLPLFLPFFDFLGNTIRYDGAAWEGHASTDLGAGEKLSLGVFNFQQFATGSLRPVHLLALILPRALGTPAHATWWGREPWSEVYLYIGAAALLALLFAAPSRAGPRLRALGLCGLLGLWLALGSHFGAAQVLYHLPLLDNFRRPARWDILFVLALAAWSGHGLQRWLGTAHATRRHAWLWALAGGAAVFGLLCGAAESPSLVAHLLRVAGALRPLNPAKDYAVKLTGLLRDWKWDGAVFAVSAAALALGGHIRTRRLAPWLFMLLALDLLHIDWLHFYAFPSDFYRRPPVSLAALDLSTRPFWRVDHYLEYPGTEMWQMHHDPLRRLDLYRREKTALSYGISAVFGIPHVGAHMPLLWPWDSSLTPGEKSARYLLANVDLTRFHGSPLQPLARFDSVRVYTVLDWKPRLEVRRARPAPPDTAPTLCPAGFSGYGGLCVHQPWDGDVEVRGSFGVGDTLIFREHWHRGWRLRVNQNGWMRPSRYRRVFMQHIFAHPADRAEWKF